MTDDFSKVEGQPVIEQYEPEDKEALVSVYNDVLRTVNTLEPNKNPMYQLEEYRKSNRGNSNSEQTDEKIKELHHMIKRDVASLRENTKEELKNSNRTKDFNEVVEEAYSELLQYKVTDRHNFEQQGDQSEGVSE